MEQLIVALFVILFALEFAIEFGLNELNLRYVRARWAEKKIPDFFQGKISSDEYDKSVQYTLAKGRFERWSMIYGGGPKLAGGFFGGVGGGGGGGGGRGGG